MVYKSNVLLYVISNPLVRRSGPPRIPEPEL